MIHSTKKTALVTGATSGIGMAVAQRLATCGYRLIITGRRQDRLTEVARLLSTNTDVHTLCFDVRNPDEVFTHIENLPAEWKDIDVLVNNAGLAVGLHPVHEGVLDDWDRMLDTNVKGVLYMLKAVIPGMIARKTGHIIQISSIAGKEVYPNGNVYCASKHALDSITASIRMELLPHHIKVTSIHPGMVETEFSLVRFKGDEKRSKLVYEWVEALTANDVADTVVYCVQVPPHVSIHELVVMPSAQATARMVRKKDGSI